ncbi:hypothetical protein [Vibrio mimicus]|uniref:hypothetical protein n=1 Tax=Vibrio mimicus TaxID=674 RepID=UPI00076B8B16|nr:hypothetical protein [Vibrio mimicus]AMG02371.1 hypothetical protein AL543_04975 [Vibrio mimicus]
MNFQDIFQSIKSHLVAFVTFAVLFSAASFFIWSEYKEIQIEKQEISTRQLDLKNAELTFEKEKSKSKLELKDKENQLFLKEFQMDNARKEMENQIVRLKASLSDASKGNQTELMVKEEKLDALIEQYQKQLTYVQSLEKKYSYEMRKSEIEDRVLALMSEFSSLGIDIKSPDWCDKEYTQRYNKGKAIIDQVGVLVRTYNLGDKYQTFILTHTRGIVWSNDGVCNK